MADSPISPETITQYASDLSSWEVWQREYRFGALFLFPPNPLRDQVNALRAKYDPRSQAICDAHISLTIPLPRIITARDWAELMQVTSRIAPFTVTYGPPRSYAGIPGVVLNIEPFEQFKQLVLALESVDAFAQATPRRYPFSPHMTIAEFITLERTEELLKELPREELMGAFECHAVSFAVPDEAFHFAERAFLALKG
jgi:2'-5' RNA ligase